MKKICLILICVISITACTTTSNVVNEPVQKNKSVSSAEDGSSYENAIVINEKSESAGVPSEYTWIRTHYPGSVTLGQSLVFNKNKPYDILRIKTKEGEEKEIYFDISKFYGKF
jgi:hypothetical protein